MYPLAPPIFSFSQLTHFVRYWKDGEFHQLQHQKFLQSQENLWNVQQI